MGKQQQQILKGKILCLWAKFFFQMLMVFSSVKLCFLDRHTVSLGIEKSCLEREKLLLLRFPCISAKIVFP